MSDEQLMERVISGEMEALGLLFERHKQPLFAFLSRLMQDQTAAEDIMVDAFFRLYDRRHTYRFGCKVSTWLYAIAHNLAIDHIKSRSRREHLLGKLQQETPLVEEARGQTVVERAEYAQQVREAINHLPVDQRAVIILRVYHELSYRDIAAIIGAGEDTVRVRAHRARQTLKQSLAAIRHEEPCGR